MGNGLRSCFHHKHTLVFHCFERDWKLLTSIFGNIQKPLSIYKCLQRELIPNTFRCKHYCRKSLPGLTMRGNSWNVMQYPLWTFWGNPCFPMNCLLKNVHYKSYPTWKFVSKFVIFYGTYIFRHFSVISVNSILRICPLPHLRVPIVVKILENWKDAM